MTREPPGGPRSRPVRRWSSASLAAATLTVLALGLLLVTRQLTGDGQTPEPASAPNPAASPSSPPASPSATPPSPSPTGRPDRGLVGASVVGGPWGSVEGLTMFRGNPTRTWYGAGPVPDDPEVRWRYPERAMCTQKPDKRWCGTGWTGQPVVWERPDGVTEVVFGAFDGAVHFLDGETGERTRPPFRTGDMIKGSVTLDPDGFPLLYTGSRDNRLHVVALDRERPTELWSQPAHPQGMWNNDWDGNPVVVDDLLFEGGEDSWFYAFELNRGYDAEGRVTVDPQPLVERRGWNDELLRRVGDRNVSIESSVAVFEDRVYFANSGGRVVGLDVSRVERGEAPIVLDYWMGDDVDASIVVDREGQLYVSAELERGLPRAREVGQLVRLDPDAEGDPRVWGLDVPPRPPPGVASDDGGIWATPALHDDYLYVTTHPGDLLVVAREDGEVVWREDIGYHEWSSPVVVDGTLVVAGCEAGGLLAWSLADPAAPRPIWTAELPTRACIESTPAVWQGRIWVGARDGFFYGFG